MYADVPYGANTVHFSTFTIRRLQNKWVLHVGILMDSLKEMESISIHDVIFFFCWTVCYFVFMKFDCNLLFKFQNITKVEYFFGTLF